MEILYPYSWWKKINLAASIIRVIAQTYSIHFLSIRDGLFWTSQHYGSDQKHHCNQLFRQLFKER